MTEPIDQVHEPFRELISQRFNGELNVAADAALSGHLADCPNCRQVDHDYSEQRRLLRAMPPAVPPRDLWARTSAALDRELLREARHGGLPRSSGQRQRGALAALTRPSSVPSVLLVSSASFVLASVLLITQLGPSLRLPTGGGGAEATPFAGGVALAFVGTDASGLTLYRTHVDEGCPNSAECPGEDALEARVSFPASFEPDTLSLAPGGNRLAIMGNDGARANVFAVMDVPPLDAGAPDDAPSRPRPRVPQATATAVITPSSSVLVVAQTPAPSAAGGSDPAAIPGELVVSTILDGVYGVGSAPAWSADGQALAFSAMPSDRSTGPDIYIWRVGDGRAQPVTDDHRSYFASWSGRMIIASRAVTASDNVLSAPRVSTVAINLATHEQRTVRGPELWLPQLDPRGQRAVGWHGQLGWRNGEVVPVHGALYLVDWAALNPFGDAAPVVEPTADAVDMTGGYAGTPTMTPDLSTPNPTTAPPPTADPAATAPPTPRAPIVTDPPPADGGDAQLTPIEPARDPLQHPVTDWRVMWSTDGHLLAEWVGSETSSAWGRLSVLAVGSDGVLASAPLLTPTPAKRGFNLATNRIAWVAPREDTLNGELRLRMWGAAGVHDVRVKPLDSTGVVAAF